MPLYWFNKADELDIDNLYYKYFSKIIYGKKISMSELWNPYIYKSKGNQNLDINKKNKPQIFVEELQRQENFLLPTEYNDTIRYESKEYKKINNLFNFHSWLPIFLNLKKVNFQRQCRV